MIDFRYHLVSLVSVFLALAVGIVLGAGPLKDAIGQTITEDAASLRQQTASLRSQLDTASSGIAHRDDFVDAVAPALVSGQLSGHSVVLVLLPDADTAIVKPLTQALKTSGARVTGQVEVQGRWTDPAEQALRDRIVTQVEASLPATTSGPAASGPAASGPAASGPAASGPAASGPAASGPPAPRHTTTSGTANERLSGLLARALVTAEISQTQRLDDTARTVLKGLSGAGLVAVDGEVASRATEVVVVAPAVDQNADKEVSTSNPAPVDAGKAFSELAIVLDGACDGVVVVGPASSARSGGVVAAVRGDSDTTKVVSTVDTGGGPMGVVSAVLALREQLSGGSGSYGFGDGARSPLPALAGSAS
jgi:hypothetical protein